MFVSLKFGAKGRGTAVLDTPAASETFVSDSALPVGGVTPPSPSPRPTTGSRRVPPRIKTYRVAEVRLAMAAARRELGEEAILIQTKRIDPPEDGLKYEVTFGIAGDENSHPAPERSIAAAAPSAVAQRPREEHDWAEELRRLRAEIAALHEIVSRSYGEPVPGMRTDRHLLGLQNRLLQHGIDPDLANEWLSTLAELREHETTESVDATATMLESVLASRVSTDSSLGWDESSSKGMMLVGPPGSGKTTALLKLALEFGIRRSRAIQLWVLDPRGNALDHSMDSFSQLLNIVPRVFRSPYTLAVALGKVDLNDNLVLIDTRGFGIGLSDADQALSTMLSRPQPIDCHLVLPAAWHSSALSRAVDQYEIFAPSRLLFTMVDQTRAFGSLLQEPWRTRKPLSFLSEGGLGSGTIRPASLNTILESIDQVTGQPQER